MKFVTHNCKNVFQIEKKKQCPLFKTYIGTEIWNEQSWELNERETDIFWGKEGILYNGHCLYF